MEEKIFDENKDKFYSIKPGLISIKYKKMRKF